MSTRDKSCHLLNDREEIIFIPSSYGVPFNLIILIIDIKESNALN